MLLNGITLGQTQPDNIKQMVSIGGARPMVRLASATQWDRVRPMASAKLRSNEAATTVLIKLRLLSLKDEDTVGAP